ncbi:right-handed parallel beta-helix repeat-containing protein [Halogeometricum limi]|uniref:Right handed beta helix region n=1 Tax=Halogeometricum limi TaxID=555875 RepID=A0A1I6GWK7_9EURY|nr:right-handed parallel beta-helix repeat-containing protein [Halogeometricum limi]SFR46459.1 Right handed beta helix region [Halogeometricum limi]
MRNNRIVATLVVALVVVGGAGAEVAYASATPVDAVEQVRLSSCTTLTTPGAYTLTRDVVSETYDCFRVESGGVVLDGGGHSVTPSDRLRVTGERLGMPTPSHVGVGVRVVGGSDVVVTDFRFAGLDVGVVVSGASDVTVADVDAENSATGVLVESSSNVVLADARVTGSVEDGVVFRAVRNGTVTESVVTDGRVAGLVLQSVENGRVDGVTVDGNAGDGVLVTDATGVRLANVSARSNGVGVLLMDASDVEATRLEADANLFAGIGLVRSDGNRFADVRVGRTTGTQRVVDAPSEVWLYASAENCFADVRVTDSSGWVVYARDGSRENRFVNVEREETAVSFVGSDAAVAFADAHAVTDATDARQVGPLVVEPTGPDWSFRRGVGPKGGCIGRPSYM